MAFIEGAQGASICDTSALNVYVSTSTANMKSIFLCPSLAGPRSHQLPLFFSAGKLCEEGARIRSGGTDLFLMPHPQISTSLPSPEVRTSSFAILQLVPAPSTFLSFCRRENVAKIGVRVDGGGGGVSPFLIRTSALNRFSGYVSASTGDDIHMFP